MKKVLHLLPIGEVDTRLVSWLERELVELFRIPCQALYPALDPAFAYDTDVWRILTITNDGLLAYRKVGGPDGAMLVPDLASALPDVSADGLTYRFPLREGIRYSNGEPLRPEDFRRGIERSLGLHGAGSLLSPASPPAR